MDIITNVALGICLSAACGFRVFAPFFILSAAGLAGYLAPADDLAWIASWPALSLFGTATLVEVIAYYIPWADNLLDTIATPAALIAGAVASASVLGDFSPALQWILAAVVGGGSAGLVQGATVLVRGASTATTGGTGNFVVATIENILSLGTAALGLIIPILVVVAIVVAGLLTWRYISALHRRGISKASL